MYVPDDYDRFAMHDAEQERELKRYPICEYCEEHITDDKAYCIEDVWYHKQCFKECFEREVIPE